MVALLAVGGFPSQTKLCNPRQWNAEVFSYKGEDPKPCECHEPERREVNPRSSEKNGVS